MSEDKTKTQDGQDKNVQDKTQDLEGQELNAIVTELVKDPEKVKELLLDKRKANAEAKKYRLQVEKTQADAEAKRQEELKKTGQFEQLYNDEQSKSKKLENQIKNLKLEHTLIKESTQLGVADPDLIIAFIDKRKIKWDDEGQVISDSVEEAIEDLKERKPHLFTKGDVPTTDAGKPKIKTTPTDSKGKALGKLFGIR